mgnify:CR=1 FL=1
MPSTCHQVSVYSPSTSHHFPCWFTSSVWHGCCQNDGAQAAEGAQEPYEEGRRCSLLVPFCCLLQRHAHRSSGANGSPHVLYFRSGVSRSRRLARNLATRAAARVLAAASVRMRDCSSLRQIVSCCLLLRCVTESCGVGRNMRGAWSRSNISVQWWRRGRPRCPRTCVGCVLNLSFCSGHGISSHGRIHGRYCS